MAKWLRKWRRGWLYVRSNTKNAKSLITIFLNEVLRTCQRQSQLACWYSTSLGIICWKKLGEPYLYKQLRLMQEFPVNASSHQAWNMRTILRLNTYSSSVLITGKKYQKTRCIYLLSMKYSNSPGKNFCSQIKWLKKVISCPFYQFGIFIQQKNIENVSSSTYMRHEVGLIHGIFKK